MLVDTGAEHSVLLSPLGKTSSKTFLVQGVMGSSRYSWTTARTVNLGTRQVSHSFLVIPESPAPLIGRDHLHKIGAHIHFSRGTVSLTDDSGAPLTVLTLALQDEHILYSDPGPSDIPLHVRLWVDSIPKVWAELSGVGLAINQPPIIIPFKSGATPIQVKQYPISAEARDSIQPHIKRLLASGILTPCKSPWNTPLLLVRKPGMGDYRPIQDFREVNKRVEDVHPTVPKSYTLLSNLHPSLTWYTTLDLKDAFFILPLATVSQPIFAFEWFSPETHSTIQITWTQLPQGLKLSPTIFSKALAEDLKPFRQLHPTMTLLQYVDDLLITSPTEESCMEATMDLLLCLKAAGYHVSAKKAHIAHREVTFLGYLLHNGLRWLTPAKTQAILSITTPSSPR
uniref:Reverse transcriptase domain-containing protein n=1 Tax=Monodelphis domestica TaxID=13616 RepID=K7E4L9_MONDO